MNEKLTPIQVALEHQRNDCYERTNEFNGIINSLNGYERAWFLDLLLSSYHDSINISFFKNDTLLSSLYVNDHHKYDKAFIVGPNSLDLTFNLDYISCLDKKFTSMINKHNKDMKPKKKKASK